MTNEASVLWDVVEEHLDDAAFLLGGWRHAVRSPRVTLDGLQRTLEPRLIAHLDGLAVGGDPVAERLLWPALGPASEAPVPAVAAAALALLVEADGPARDRVVEALRGAELPAVREGLAQAFEMTPRLDVDQPLKLALYASDAAPAQTALLEVLAARRVDPGPILNALLRLPDPAVVGGALRAAAAAADRARLRGAVESLLDHDDPGVRGAALRTGLIWHLGAARVACPAAARAGLPQAMLLLAQLGDARELAILVEALGAAETRLPALYALGFSGRAEAVEACLPHLDDEDPRAAKLAAEAVAAVTGLPLFAAPFALPADDGELPPLAEDLTVDLTPKPLDELPRPNPDEIRKWWSAQRSRLASGKRYVRGLLLSPASVEMALREGPLRRVGATAGEIAVRTGGRLQLPAPRLGRSRPAVATDLVFQREPGWI